MATVETGAAHVRLTREQFRDMLVQFEDALAATPVTPEQEWVLLVDYTTERPCITLWADEEPCKAEQAVSAVKFR